MITLYPAIDLLGGRCVRLRRGSFDEVTVYDVDPVEVAGGFVDAGARWVHLVDLDAARTGEQANRQAILGVADTVSGRARVQVGGGVRSVDAAAELADAGVHRVVLGTIAVEAPDVARQIAARQPVALGLDVRGREVAVRGWTEGSGRDLLDVLGAFTDTGVEAVVVTQIDRDGTGDGPDVDGLAELVDAAPADLEVIASGGVGRLEHLGDLRRLAGASGRGVDGVVVGRALHDGRVDVATALAVLGSAGTTGCVA